MGADFRLEPPELKEFAVPSLGIVGTGKRVGKTTTTAYVARRLAEERDVVVVSMGRGGPAEPRVADEPPDLEALLEISRGGGHAASDYLEIAAVAGVRTIGCRRCGGGLAGATFFSNVPAGAEVARSMGPDVVVFDGSGTSLPPVATDRRILVVGAHQNREVVTGYLNAYRVLVSDLVVIAMAENGSDWDGLRKPLERLKPGLPVVAAVLRPRPLREIAGRRVAFFTAAPERIHDRQAAHLREAHGADVVLVSGNLSRRDALREDLERAAGAELYLTEVKGAAIDVVAETGDQRGVEVVLADNDLVPLEGQPDLEGVIRLLASEAVSERSLAR